MYECMQAGIDGRMIDLLSCGKLRHSVACRVDRTYYCRKRVAWQCESVSQIHCLGFGSEWQSAHEVRSSKPIRTCPKAKQQVSDQVEKRVLPFSSTVKESYVLG